MTTRTRLLAVRASLTAALAEVDALLATPSGKPDAPPWAFSGGEWMRSNGDFNDAFAVAHPIYWSEDDDGLPFKWAIFYDGGTVSSAKGRTNSIHDAMVAADAALSTTHNITTPPPTPDEIAAIERDYKDPS